MRLIASHGIVGDIRGGMGLEGIDKIGQARREVLVMVELGDVGPVGNRHQQDFAALFGVADHEGLV